VIDRPAQIRLTIALDLAAGGYGVRLSSPAAWFWVVFDDDRSGTPVEEMHSEALIPFEAFERDAAGDHLDRLFAMHMKCLGYR
jgi:hypothetical protein